jgi:hypothetical protein
MTIVDWQPACGYEDANEEERIDPMILDWERQRERERADRESSAGPTA